MKHFYGKKSIVITKYVLIELRNTKNMRLLKLLGCTQKNLIKTTASKSKIQYLYKNFCVNSNTRC